MMNSQAHTDSCKCQSGKGCTHAPEANPLGEEVLLALGSLPVEPLLGALLIAPCSQHSPCPQRHEDMSLSSSQRHAHSKCMQINQ